LIVDDDPALVEAVAVLLEASGYQVSKSLDGADALQSWPRSRPELAICDFHMPGGGLDLLRAMSSEAGIPVIVLSADHNEELRVAALDAGADDYITKPFSAAELLARIRVVLRRAPSGKTRTEAGMLQLDPEEVAARSEGKSVRLTPTEFAVLRVLADRPGFVPTADLLRMVWGPLYRSEVDYVRIYISRIRKKLEKLGLHGLIESAPGLGYRLSRPSSD
jgi:two-component system KDP operon response regulator KdpE